MSNNLIIFSLPGNESLSGGLIQRLNAETGEAVIRKFPDQETYIRIVSNVKDKTVVLVCTLNRPDEKFIPIYFFSQTAKMLGANKILLVAPYLSYMRQDKQFKEGEGITSAFFGQLLSKSVDAFVTVDPHLHRINSLEEIYSIPTIVVHAAAHISNWIRSNIDKPVLIGPDSESKQWVAEVAKNADAPFMVLEKIRYGDREVEIALSGMDQYLHHTPVLVDDIISTAQTMIVTVKHLKIAGMQPPVCIGIHAVFAGNAYQELRNAGAARIATCNTIKHDSNDIDISDLLGKSIKRLTD